MNGDKSVIFGIIFLPPRTACIGTVNWGNSGQPVEKLERHKLEGVNHFSIKRAISHFSKGFLASEQCSTIFQRFYDCLTGDQHMLPSTPRGCPRAQS